MNALKSVRRLTLTYCQYGGSSAGLRYVVVVWCASDFEGGRAHTHMSSPHTQHGARSYSLTSHVRTQCYSSYIEQRLPELQRAREIDVDVRTRRSRHPFVAVQYGESAALRPRACADRARHLCAYSDIVARAHRASVPSRSCVAAAAPAPCHDTRHTPAAAGRLRAAAASNAHARLASRRTANGVEKAIGVKNETVRSSLGCAVAHRPPDELAAPAALRVTFSNTLDARFLLR